jgi:IS5 family transposase
MFKKTSLNTQYDLFCTPSGQLGKRGSKKYDDPKSWHNQFYSLITSRIDEDIFKPLFKSSNMGAPTASIRTLIAMSVLKEGFGCSDEDLFEKCEFDLLTRKALGLLSLNDECPSLNTYYLLRRRICDHEKQTGENLMERCFESLTHSQIAQFKISGKSVRMDSKLIGSNIAWYSRFEIIHHTFRHFLTGIGESGMLQLNPNLRNQVSEFLKEDAQKMVYRSVSDEIESRLVALGLLIYQVITRLRKRKVGDLSLLERVFFEQYEVVKGKAIPRSKEEISAKSVQNHNDPEAQYRKKDEQKVKGYSTNLTETCQTEEEDKNKPNLIVKVQVEPVGTADSAFLRNAIQEAQSTVLDDKVETIYADGAYQSPENRAFAQENGIELVSTGLQGKPGRYDLRMEGEELVVTDTLTNKTIECLKREGNWRIKTEKGGYRYFTAEQVAICELRRQLANIPPEKLMNRNNVEATIFQYCFHTRNNKTRYRGLMKHKLFSYARCLWVNCVRLINYLRKTGLSALETSVSGFLYAVQRRMRTIIMTFKQNLVPNKIISTYTVYINITLNNQSLMKNTTF